MNKAYIFKRADQSDLREIRDLTILAYMQFQNVIAKENVEAWKRGRDNENTYIDLFKIAHCFVCEYENRIVGSSFLVPHGNPDKWFESEWAYIRLLAVHPDFEGNGIGRKLTQMSIDAAKETGETIVALHTSEFQDAARHIYESLGFAKQRDLDLIYGKQYYLYTLELS